MDASMRQLQKQRASNVVECRTSTWLTGHRFCFAPLDMSHVIGATPIASHIRCKWKLKRKTCSFVNHFWVKDVMASSVFSPTSFPRHTTSFPFIFYRGQSSTSCRHAYKSQIVCITSPIVLPLAPIIVPWKGFYFCTARWSMGALVTIKHALLIWQFSNIIFSACRHCRGRHLAFPFSFYIIIHCIASRFHGLMFQFFHWRQYAVNSCRATSACSARREQCG